jgi:hypothetical protein
MSPENDLQPRRQYIGGPVAAGSRGDGAAGFVGIGIAGRLLLRQ